MTEFHIFFHIRQSRVKRMKKRRGMKMEKEKKKRMMMF
jgi:hypothetical protein